MTQPSARPPTEAIERWATDFPAYAEDLLKINTPEGELIHFKLNSVQRAILDIIADIRKNGRYVRLLIYKLRRTGVSTLFAARNFWRASTNPNHNAMMITHEPAATDFVFGMSKRFLAHLPSPVKPSVLYDNRKVLEFNKKSRKGGLDSSLRVGTAGKENFGSSQLVQSLHATEFAKWPEHSIKPLMTSLMPCIPKTSESEIILESTADGATNMFYDMYWTARYKYDMYLDGQGNLSWRCRVDEKATSGNIWSAVFIPWYVFDKCSMPVASWERQTGLTFELDDEEKKFVETYLKGVTTTVAMQKMAWRRLTLANDFEGDIQRMNQEYPPDAEAGFMSTGSAVFDRYQILQMIEKAPQPVAKYDVDAKTGTFTYGAEGRLWVWAEPRAEMSYVISADVAEGITIEGESEETAKHDFSVAQVYEQLSGRMVAEWHGKCDPDEFGRLLVFLGNRYNTAWLIPESNNHGHTTISAILNMGYRKLYVERVIEPPHQPRKRYGFSTRGGRDGGVRAEAMNALLAAVRDCRSGIVSIRTLNEMKSMIRDAKGKFVAERGRHDDCVVCAAIAKFCIPLLPLPASARAVQAQQQAASYPRMPMPGGTPIGGAGVAYYG